MIGVMQREKKGVKGGCCIIKIIKNDAQCHLHPIHDVVGDGKFVNIIIGLAEMGVLELVFQGIVQGLITCQKKYHIQDKAHQ